MLEQFGGGGDVFWGDKAVHRLSELIVGAQKHLILVSPYVQLDGYRTLTRDLKAALKRSVQIRLVVRSRDNSTRQDVTASADISELRSLGLKLYEVKDLHAKVYLSEKAALVTSLNLLQSSFNNSIEIGVRLDAGTSQYKQVYGFLSSTIKDEAKEVTGTVDPVRSERPARLKSKEGRRSHKREVELADDEGFCIRCEEDIDLDPEKPLCRSCYRDWRDEDDSDPYEPENFCHGCGDEEITSVAKPLCRDCYKLQAA